MRQGGWFRICVVERGREVAAQFEGIAVGLVTSGTLHTARRSPVWRENRPSKIAS